MCGCVYVSFARFVSLTLSIYCSLSRAFFRSFRCSLLLPSFLALFPPHDSLNPPSLSLILPLSLSRSLVRQTRQREKRFGKEDSLRERVCVSVPLCAKQGAREMMTMMMIPAKNDGACVCMCASERASEREAACDERRGSRYERERERESGRQMSGSDCPGDEDEQRKLRRQLHVFSLLHSLFPLRLTLHPFLS